MAGKLPPGNLQSSMKAHDRRPNQALERTAARRLFTFQMTKRISVEAAFVVSGGRSACFR